jgi:hypothetical protein
MSLGCFLELRETPLSDAYVRECRMSVTACGEEALCYEVQFLTVRGLNKTSLLGNTVIDISIDIVEIPLFFFPYSLLRLLQRLFRRVTGE